MSVNILKELKPIVTEKHCFDNRNESFLLNKFLQTLDYQDFIGGIKFIGLVNKTPTPGKGLSIDVLLEDIKPVVQEKIEFEF